MRRLFVWSTLLFWLAVAGFRLAGGLRPEAPGSEAGAAGNAHILAEVAAHDRPEDCWMAIAGRVYDLTAYLPEHPSSPSVILSWCGKEATEAYATKTRGRSHSSYADQLLAEYRIGTLRPQP